MPSGIYIRTQETRKKMSEAKRGKPSGMLGKIAWNKGKKLHYSVWNKGKKRPEMTGEKNWNYGKKFSEESKKKMSESHIGLNIGEKHPNWKGGISKIDKRCRIMSEYKKWRSNIFKRDNWTCQTCIAKGCYVTVHHIKGFSLIIKENLIKSIEDARKCMELWDLNNGVTLCENCHSLTDNYRGRAKKLIYNI